MEWSSGVRTEIIVRTADLCRLGGYWRDGQRGVADNSALSPDGPSRPDAVQWAMGHRVRGEASGRRVVAGILERPGVFQGVRGGPWVFEEL